MKNQTFSQRTRQGSEALVFGILSLVAFVTVGMTILSGSDFVRDQDKMVARLSGQSIANSFTSERWKAECRTLVAMIRYVFEAEPEPIAPLSSIRSKPAAPIQITATNSATKA